MQTVKAGALYFAIVFGVGFLLGPIRLLWVVPRLGARVAEILEAPIMLVVSMAAARWIVLKVSLLPTTTKRLGMGGAGLALMIVAEFLLVLPLRGVSLREYFATRDPVAGTVYYATLALFALMPLLVARKQMSIQQPGRAAS
jgi:hypothetical protein